MIRNAPRRRVLLVVVIALVGLNIVPIDECDDYAFFHPGAASAQAGVPVDDSSGSDHQHICSCVVCDLTTNDSFAPRLQTPQRGEVVAAVPAVLCSSAFLPAIFRPPIA
jgi:hypothetical protein